MILIIDHFDSFSHNLLQLVGGLQLEARVCRCDEIGVEELLEQRPRAILLSPGPGRPEDTHVTPRYLADPRSWTIPCIGVCLGFQAMSLAWGGEVVPAAEIVHGKTVQLARPSHPIFSGLSDPLVVGRYHSLCVPVDSLPQSVEVLCRHREMAMFALDRHKPWAGLQFHPESFLTPQGPELVLALLGHFKVLGDRTL